MHQSPHGIFVFGFEPPNLHASYSTITVHAFLAYYHTYFEQHDLLINLYHHHCFKNNHKKKTHKKLSVPLAYARVSLCVRRPCEQSSIAHVYIDTCLQQQQQTSLSTKNTHTQLQITQKPPPIASSNSKNSPSSTVCWT